MSSEQQPEPEAQQKKSAYGLFHSAREWVTPTLKSSAFLERGVLTPEEFVKAGDELVYRCPTWSWEGGDPNRTKSYLPPDKQYLVTRNVPCQNRVADLEIQVCLDDVLAGGDGDDEDFSNITFQKNPQKKETNIEDEFDILDEEGEIIEPTKPADAEPSADNDDDDEEEEYADMADFEDDNVIQDTDAVMASTAAGACGGGSGGGGTGTAGKTSEGAATGDDDGHILKVRTYDLSLTYDKYYQTPRVWAIGQSDTGQPLSGEQMMEDVIQDYAHKTVTIEAHPNVAGPHLSIHPCKHGKVMKTIVQNLIRGSAQQCGSDDNAAVEKASGGDEPTVEMYLFIFLKFVSSIIPTVNYDFTMDVTASTKK